jgi:endonuclease/exonuclease/phosphatase (EEP) superfamily protein YafD
MIWRIVKWGTIAAVVLLVAGFVGPWSKQADSLSHFRHVLVIIALMGAVFALMRKQKILAGLAAISAIAAVVLSYPHLPFLGPQAEGKGTYKLIQFNVKIHNARAAEAAQWIVSEKPDVVMLQEVLDETHPSFRLLDPILPYRARCKSARLGDVAVYTRFPEIIQYCSAGSGLAWIQVNADGTPITFASLHLKWPWPRGQWDQLEQLRSELQNLKQPVVLGGDHNAAPWSAAVRTVERWTKSKVISGYRTTFWPDVLHNEAPWPALPIDHVLIPEGFRVESIRTGPVMGSDHKPVVVEWSVTK